MKTAIILLIGLSLNLVLKTHAQLRDGKPTETRVTHGPMLGRPASDSMSLWVRTERPGKVRVLYGTKKKKFTHEASVETNDISRDNTAIITINKLKSNTRYYYRIADHQLEGSFRTMPSAVNFKNPKGNPEGLFNFKFEFACGNNQGGGGDSAGPTVPCLLYTSPSPRDKRQSRMPSSA